jgi:hypothetical protein
LNRTGGNGRAVLRALLFIWRSWLLVCWGSMVLAFKIGDLVATPATMGGEILLTMSCSLLGACFFARYCSAANMPSEGSDHGMAPHRGMARLTTNPSQPDAVEQRLGLRIPPRVAVDAGEQRHDRGGPFVLRAEAAFGARQPFSRQPGDGQKNHTHLPVRNTRPGCGRT